MCGCGNNCGCGCTGNNGCGNMRYNFQPCSILLVIAILASQGLLDGGKASKNALTLLFLYWLCGCNGGCGGGCNNGTTNCLPVCCCENRCKNDCKCNCGCKCVCKCKPEKCKCKRVKVCCC